ncbi:hypothetical protein P12x_004280 [Tundrisphaera lichenicola]|uniref:hypothetical protein n=1 Tax=Tundrisphaera lichenicola TaxID=2029860 RepID=UPI003EBCC98E
MAWLFVLVIGLLHTWAIWTGLGGQAGFESDWPLLYADHSIHFYHGLVSRHFLQSTGLMAGYDPSFMSGYAMSIVSDLSSAFSSLFVFAFPSRPALSYKLHVLFCASIVPWLVAFTAAAWRLRPSGVVAGVALYTIYFWTAFPANYSALGMMDYILSVPLGLLAVSGLTAYLERGGLFRWFVASMACSAVFLVHVTSPMLVGPAAILAYAVAVRQVRRTGGTFPVSRHIGLFAIAPVILALNAFWWIPGLLLASTKGSSDLAFAHPESVLGRLVELFWQEPAIEVIALGLAIVGLASLARRLPIASAGLGGFLVAGFGWGYLAGFSRSLDFLQPGRHTNACFTAACIAAGIGIAEILARMRSARSGRLDRLAAVGFILIGLRIFGYPMVRSVLGRLDFNPIGVKLLAWPDPDSIRRRFGPEPFLSSLPKPRAVWLVDRVQKYLKPGERLLFEEAGLAGPGRQDPFEGRHLSPILPLMTGVEVIGGPYLHSTVTTNFTQFGEGKLFGVSDWNRDQFERYARLYRPSAIVCWSPKSRAFCQNHADLIEILEDDGILLIARIRGFGGDMIRGTGRVEAGPNRLTVHDAKAGNDGLVVLRYHDVPFLRTDPPIPIERVYLEEDPVPFIGFRPIEGTLVIEMDLWRRVNNSP